MKLTRSVASMASDLVDLHYLDIFHPDRLHSDEVCDVALEVISALQPELRISMWQQSLQVEGATCFIISSVYPCTVDWTKN